MCIISVLITMSLLGVFMCEGGLLHDDVPLRCSDNSVNSRRAARRFADWCKILLDARLETTQRC